MTKMKLFTVLTIALAVAAVAPLAAQTVVLKANVPFEFHFAGKILPAGQYLLQANGGSSAMQLRNFDADAGAVSLGWPSSRRTDRGTDSTLTFNRYGSTYFLSSVVNGSSGAGMEFPTTRTERELARTQTAQKHEILAVVAGL